MQRYPRKIIWLIFMTSTAIALILTNLHLPTFPEITLYPTTLLFSLFLYLLLEIILLTKTNTKRGMLNIIITISVVGIAIFSSRPESRTIQQAIEINRETEQTIQVGIQAAEQVNSGQLDERTAKEQISASLSGDTNVSAKRSLAENAFENIISSNTDPIQVIDELNPQIPLKQDAWNCTNDGCAYKGQQHIFTISYNIQWSSTLLLISAFTLRSVWQFKHSK